MTAAGERLTQDYVNLRINLYISQRDQEAGQ